MGTTCVSVWFTQQPHTSLYAHHWVFVDRCDCTKHLITACHELLETASLWMGGRTVLLATLSLNF